jgi:benzodiazapine receptor
MKLGKIAKLVAFILLCEFAGIVGSFFTTPSIGTWYATLQKPWFTPPNWLFGPVWITLYFLMGVSLYLVWEKGIKKKDVKVALYIFGIQLVLNVFWSILFFGLQSPLYGFVEIVVLWTVIAITIFKFYKVSKKAAILLMPYIAWVTIAATLNYYVLVLNP